MKENY